MASTWSLKLSTTFTAYSLGFAGFGSIETIERVGLTSRLFKSASDTWISSEHMLKLEVYTF